MWLTIDISTLKEKEERKLYITRDIQTKVALENHILPT